MSEQISLFPVSEKDNTQEKLKRKWENAFQRWSDEQAQDGMTSLGVCGYGSMCEWCEDNSYGRPCVRALNSMCREKKLKIDYTDCTFDNIWEGADMRGEQE